MKKDEICYCRFLDGDESGLEELIGIYKNSMTLFINSIVKSMDISEELMIDTFAQLVVSKSKFKRESSLKTYLFQIARNEAFRYMKKHKKNLALSIEEIDKAVLSDYNTAFPEEKIINDEKHIMLHKCLKKIKPDYAIALYLIYFEDMSYDEVCSVMKKSNKKITNIVYRGKKSS